jgi:hypothetical protein
MYNPDHFLETGIANMHDAIDARPLGSQSQRLVFFPRGI